MKTFKNKTKILIFLAFISCRSSNVPLHISEFHCQSNLKVDLSFQEIKSFEDSYKLHAKNLQLIKKLQQECNLINQCWQKTFKEIYKD